MFYHNTRTCFSYRYVISSTAWLRAFSNSINLCMYYSEYTYTCSIIVHMHSLSFGYRMRAHAPHIIVQYTHAHTYLYTHTYIAGTLDNGQCVVVHLNEIYTHARAWVARERASTHTPDWRHDWNDCRFIASALCLRSSVGRRRCVSAEPHPFAAPLCAHGSVCVCVCERQ